jgi:hypothetical protein
LPAVTVARLEELGSLMERIMAVNQSLFIEKGQQYKEAHRQGSSRQLTPLEAAQIAAVIADENKLAEAGQVQASSLRAYDPPETREILLAAGIAVAPAFLAAVREAVALVEMPADEFKAACEDGTLDQAIEEAAKPLRWLEAEEAKARASAAFAHYARAAGFEPGEALRLPVQAVWQALSGAVNHLVDASQSSQLTGSAESTEDSPAQASSTS